MNLLGTLIIALVVGLFCVSSAVNTMMFAVGWLLIVLGTAGAIVVIDTANQTSRRRTRGAFSEV